MKTRQKKRLLVRRTLVGPVIGSQTTASHRGAEDTMVSLEWPSTQAISKLKKRFTCGRWEVGKGKFCSREVVQAAHGSMRVGQRAYVRESGLCDPSGN